MAIHPLLQGIEACICVNKIPLTEYDDEEAFPGKITSPSGRPIKIITKYIESAADQEFSIMYKIDALYKADSPCHQFDFSLDGTRCLGTIMKPASRGSTHYVDGVDKPGHGGLEGFLLPFKFKSIETTLDGQALRTLESDKKAVLKSGQITVEVYRSSESIAIPTPATRLPDLGLGSKVHEKALKGDPKYHGASLGNARTVVPPTYASATKLDGDDSPILRFVFKYRSNKALKELMIIERSPEPEEHEVPKLGSSAKQNGSQSANIKRERESDAESSRGNKRPKNNDEVELIDLTDD